MGEDINVAFALNTSLSHNTLKKGVSRNIKHVTPFGGRDSAPLNAQYCYVSCHVHY